MNVIPDTVLRSESGALRDFFVTCPRCRHVNRVQAKTEIDTDLAEEGVQIAVSVFVRPVIDCWQCLYPIEPQPGSAFLPLGQPNDQISR